MRMLKYACSVKGNIKQISKSKNSIRISVYNIRKYGRSVKAAFGIFEQEGKVQKN